MRDHAAIEELIAIRALGGLERDEEFALSAQRSAHGEECEECLRLEATYGEVAGRLAFAIEPAEVREGMEDELVARARAEAGQPNLRAATPAPALDGNRAARRDSAPRLPKLAAALVAAVVVLSAGIAGYLIAPRGDSVIAADIKGIIESPDGRLVHLEGADAGILTLVYRPGERDVYLLGSDLPTPPSGKTLELWMFRGKTPISGGCFAPEDGSLVEHVEADLSGADQMAVTVEPTSCPSAPTSEPILSAPL